MNNHKKAVLPIEEWQDCFFRGFNIETDEEMLTNGRSGYFRDSTYL